jgi:serine/threonine protein kinase
MYTENKSRKFINSKLSNVSYQISKQQKINNDVIKNKINDECKNATFKFVCKRLPSIKQKVISSIKNKLILDTTQKLSQILKPQIGITYKIELDSGKSYNLIPFYSEDESVFNNKIFIDTGNNIGLGGFAVVYLKHYNKKNLEKQKKDNYVFKLIDFRNINNTSKKNELFGLFFNYLLQKYYTVNITRNLEYICFIKEFGMIKDSEIFYAYMNNCGTELFKYSFTQYYNNGNINKIIKELFIKCLKSLKMIHDLGYLHLDIKRENFLLNQNLNLKIIDFGFVKKCEYKTNTYFGTAFCIANDWLKNTARRQFTILEKHHDIFSLGCTFLELIYNNIFPKELEIKIGKAPFMVCPNIYQEIEDEIIWIRRQRYDESSHEANMNILQSMLSETKLSKNSIFIKNTMFKMCNPIPKNRFQTTDEIIEYIENNYIE